MKCQTEKVYYSYVESKKKINQMNKVKQKQSHRYREQVSCYQRVVGWAKWVKGVNCMVMIDVTTCGGHHFLVYIDVGL